MAAAISAGEGEDVVLTSGRRIEDSWCRMEEGWGEGRLGSIKEGEGAEVGERR